MTNQGEVITLQTGANGGGPAVVPPSPLLDQPTCKPGSVGRGFPRVTAIPLRRRLPGASSNLPGRLVRTTDLGLRYSRAAPIRFCSRWGLPCRSRCRQRGALLPHRFTLAAASRRGGGLILCGTFPGVAPAGRYPAPFVHGARTFLPGDLSVLAGAAVQPTDARNVGPAAQGVNSAMRPHAAWLRAVERGRETGFSAATKERRLEWRGSIMSGDFEDHCWKDIVSAGRSQDLQAI